MTRADLGLILLVALAVLGSVFAVAGQVHDGADWSRVEDSP